MKIGFVCTNYNNSSYTRAAVASLRAGSRTDDVHVVVVDNSSHPEDIASLRVMLREFPGVELILNQKNVGYFPGLNIGIRHLRAQFPEIQHLVIGNNDLTFPGNFVEMVDRHRRVFDEWAVVAPDLVTPDGVHQNPHVLHPISSARKLVWDLYHLSYPTAILIKHVAGWTKSFTAREENAPGSDLHATPGPVEQGYGACYLLGPLFFQHFRHLFAPTFLMQEEYFLNEQLKTIGQMTYYDPRFMVTHAGHATMDAVPNRRLWAFSRDAHLMYKRYRSMSLSEQRALVAAETSEGT